MSAVRVFFSSLGCKLNQAELEAMARRFSAAGHGIAPSLAEADLHVVNTCTVTHRAARDSRKLARRGRRLNPELRTVLTGCYVAAEPEAAARLAGVDLVVPNHEKERLLDQVLRLFPGARPGGAAEPLPIPYVPLDFGNSRALVKIEDGCNMRCAFCVIPATRGRQRSRRLPDVVAEVAALAAGGFEEVVVTGVQISAYRWRRAGLYELLAALLERTEVKRLRLTSIAPWQFDPRLLSLFDGGRLCRHVHLSLQSGSDATLRRMRRPYTARSFADLAGTIRRAVPGVAITTDVITGFPGESPAEAAESLRFVEEQEFARIHAFPYSPRAGTEAAAMSGQVPHAVKRRRMERLLASAAASRKRFWRRHLGSRLEVLWERRRDGRWLGTTDNYIPVRAAHRHRAAGRLGPALLERVTEEGVACRDAVPRPGSRPRQASC